MISARLCIPGFDHVSDPASRIEMNNAATRAIEALVAAIADPTAARHRCDITNALNYIETVQRQHAASAIATGAAR